MKEKVSSGIREFKCEGVNGRRYQSLLEQFRQRMWRKGERGQKKNEQMKGGFGEMGKVMEWELRERKGALTTARWC